MTSGSGEQTVVQLRTLGAPEVLLGGEPAPRELQWRKNLALLVYLARARRGRRTREHLVGLLWGGKPESAARHSLNEAVRVIRRSAGESVLRTEGRHLVANEELLELDAELLERGLEESRYEDAAALVGGEFMEGFGIPDASPFEDWLASERTYWRRRSIEALTGHAEVLLDRGDLRGAGREARRATALDPWSDAAFRLAMRTTALTGDRGAALALYGDFRGRLADELGTDPERETVRLADRIRRERSWQLPEAVDPGERDARRLPLVGRGDDLSAALQVWEEARDTGRAGVLVLEGEPGVGKTRLLEELAGRARLDGGVVCGVRAVPADMESPWSGVLGLARSGLVEAPGLVGASPDALAALAARVPEWKERFAEEIAESDADPAPLARALAEVLRAVLWEQPVLLFVDDARWLDAESAGALAAAVRDLQERPMALVLASAPPADDAPAADALDRLRSHIGRELTGVTLRLEPLDHQELDELVRVILPSYEAEQRHRLARRVEADSAGLPLLAVELLNAVRLGLELDDGEGAAASGEAAAASGEAGGQTPWPAANRTLDHTLPSDLPDPIVAAVRVGFRRLSQAAQEVAAAASVLGERFTPEVVARATPLDLPAVHEALDELEWTRWLESEPRGYTFVARIVRDVIADDMLTEGKRERIRDLTAG